MNVIPTGVIFYGVCQIASENCTAKEGGVVTAVQRLPVIEQVNVCKTCLDYQVRNREWNIEGAYVSGMKHQLDLAVVDNEGKVVIAIEAKLGKNINQQLATQIASQIITREQMDNIPFFFLVTPAYCYIWKIVNGSLNDLQMINIDSYISEIYDKLGIKFEDSETNEYHKTQNTSLSKIKEHLFFERSVKYLLEDKSFIYSLPKEIANNLEKSQVYMEYVF
jgi:hypothetical protein